MASRAEILWAAPGTDPADPANWMTVGRTLVWEPGAHTVADRWRDLPTGLDEAARRAVERWKLGQVALDIIRYRAFLMAGASVVSPRSLFRITGVF